MENIKNIILIYIMSQSLSTAIGLFFIYSTQNKVNQNILKKKYKPKYLSTTDKIANSIVDLAKALIPFYYLNRGLSIIKDNTDFENTVNKAIASGKYEQLNLEKSKEETTTLPIITEYEKPKEKFKAKRNTNIEEIYDFKETPIAYIERIIEDENESQLSPYTEMIKTEQNYKNTQNKILPLLSNLTPVELEDLINNIEQLKLIKQVSYKKTLEKDIA